MWKYGILVALALLFATLQSCSLDNDMLKPNCEVFEVELIEKSWQPTDNSESLVFRSTGQLVVGTNSTDDIKYEISNCNTVTVNNETKGTLETWTIEDLNLDRLIIRKNNEVVRYSPE